MANIYDEHVRDPGYWFGRVQQRTFRGVSMDDFVNEPAAYQALAPEHVKTVFAKYAKADYALSVIVMPIAPKDGELKQDESNPSETKAADPTENEPTERRRRLKCDRAPDGDPVESTRFVT